MGNMQDFSISNLLGSLVLTSILFFTSEANTDVEKLPYCPDTIKTDVPSQRLVFVSTLDGKLSALDAANGGEIQWSVPTGPGPMLSSSIHRLELTNNGQWVRMIPSLSGGLYKFDGESVEAVPITADSLLRSSFIYSDDLVIAGGKETRSYGVSVRSGKLIYECSMQGCHNVTSDSGNEENVANLNTDEVLIIQRQTQTIRAVDPRAGNERWNFSVGQHEIQLAAQTECLGQTKEAEPLDLEFKVIVPEGLLCAVKRNQPNVVLWKHKFSSPIVNAWQRKSNSLQAVDLFSGAQWSWNPPGAPVAPALYVGMHNKQLYVQESVNVQKLVQNQAQQYHHLITDETKYPRIPWKPYPASSSALVLWEDEDKSIESPTELAITERKDTKAITTSVLYGSEYVNGNGFYLYSSGDLNKTQNALCNKPNITIPINDDDDDPNITDGATDVNMSIWSWWKVVVIFFVPYVSILFITHRFIMRPDPVQVPTLPITNDQANMLQAIDLRRNSSRSLSESTHQISEGSYTSRFLTDFDPLACLGKGGFGVVFEAKNKIDDCNYAIKRITLPNRQESRDRVMREVRALAKLEHHNIVRYFNAWVETPPPGWQEQADTEFILKDVISTSIEVDSPSETESKMFTPEKKLPLIQKKTDIYLQSFISNNFNDQLKTLDKSFNCRKFDSGKKSKSLSEDKSDSYIVFEAASHDDQENDYTNSNKYDSNASVTSDYTHSNSLFDYGNADESDSIVFENSNHINTNEKLTENANRNGYSVISINSTNSNNHAIAIQDTNNSEKTCNNKKAFKKTHKRPMSLDLTSQGNVAPPSCLKVYLYIQMQLCRKQSLKEWLLDNSIKDRCTQVIPIFEQIVGAVEYVHMQGLIHRDLKPSNIFFSLDGQIKIGDFGLVTAMAESPSDARTPCEIGKDFPPSDKHTQQVGTHLYMSPEQLQGRSYNYKVDIYSLGLILFELLVQFNTEMERILTLKDLRKNKFPSDFQKCFVSEFQLLRLMLSEEPSKRPTTYGIKARPPLNQDCSSTDWHFELPPRKQESRSSSLSNSGSFESSGGCC